MFLNDIAKNYNIVDKWFYLHLLSIFSSNFGYIIEEIYEFIFGFAFI